ncbi:MAG: nucleotidyltransferase domain-containing protein [Hungatella sp.]|nr:nucleotidyltransferase domain-containing protein [Hungatella sp.]
MYEEKIKSVVAQFAEEIKGMFGNSLHNIILYGSCARGDFTKDSDIDLMILLDIPREEIGKARRQITDISDKFDLDNDVVLAPVIQDYQLFLQYMPASGFYQNIQKEGVVIA